MKETSEKSKYFLIISVSFWILILPTYLSFSALDDLDIVSYYACIENIDQEGSIPSSEKNEIILISTFYIKHILIAHLPFVTISNLSYQLPSLNSKSLILRC
jgi:hypothetical protein